MSILSTASRVAIVTPSDTNYLSKLEWDEVNLAPLQITSANLSTDTFTLAGSGLANGDIIVFNSVGTITGISINVPYYVIGVSGNNFQISVTYNGSAVDLTGATTTMPIFRETATFRNARAIGYIYAGTAGNINLLPADHFDTDSPTEAAMGAQIIAFAAGEIKPIVVKKVFATSTTATNIKLLFNN